MSDLSPQASDQPPNGQVERRDVPEPRPTFKSSVDSIERSFDSINLLAVSTVRRLVVSTDTWLATLEEKHARLTRELAERRDHLAELDRQIEAEQAHAEALSRSAEAWARDLRRDVSAMHSELLADVEEVEQRAHEVSQLVDSMLGSIQRSRGDENPPQATSSDTAPMPAPTPANAAGVLEGAVAADAVEATAALDARERDAYSLATVSAGQSLEVASESPAAPALIGGSTSMVTAAVAPHTTGSPGAEGQGEINPGIAERRSWSKRVVDFIFPE
jgi:septal ring factor EnvC (AmiA/AmiB activator)